MRILVTAGNTQSPIDKVRCITNIFTGRTGTQIALAAYHHGHTVTLLTSHPELVRELSPGPMEHLRWHAKPYRTFDDLAVLLEAHVSGGGFDAVVHSAAVSDFRVEGVYDRDRREIVEGKIKSGHEELWLKLTPTPKLVDRFRRDWGFQGVLVKFKLEVGLTDEQLIKVAEQSRLQSQANWMVANLFESRHQYAYLGNGEGSYKEVARRDLAEYLLRAMQE